MLLYQCVTNTQVMLDSVVIISRTVRAETKPIRTLPPACTGMSAVSRHRLLNLMRMAPASRSEVYEGLYLQCTLTACYGGERSHQNLRHGPKCFRR